MDRRRAGPLVPGPPSRKVLKAPCHEWSSLNAEEAKGSSKSEDAREAEARGETESSWVVGQWEDRAEACDASAWRHGPLAGQRSVDARVT